MTAELNGVGQPTVKQQRVEEVMRAWAQALEGDERARAHWRSEEGGHWLWEDEGLSVSSSGTEWSGLSWSIFRGTTLEELRNFVIEVAVSGQAHAAGLSFGPYKDFLTELTPQMGERYLQLEVDTDSGCWTFRIDGQLMSRCWWDAAVHSTDDLLNGVFTLKTRNAERVHFRQLRVSTFEASCHLSVIITCYRFLQRLRVALRNWCHQSLASGEYEVLVANPGSPDGTHEYLAAVARSYPNVRIREVSVRSDQAVNKGSMVNQAINSCRGEWVWLTDADCLFPLTSAALALSCVNSRESSLYYGQRRYLTASQTDALIAGRVDGLRDFDALARSPVQREPQSAPWGYTQIVHRSVFDRVRYRSNINHFAHSDDVFKQECERLGIMSKQIDGLFCLHLDHPFAWYGTNTFL